MNANNISVIKNAELIYKNFSGAISDYNKSGARTFSILITDEDMARKMMDDGWLIKPLRKRDPEDEQHWHLPVAVRFEYMPPEIILVNPDTKRKIHMTEDMIGQLDFATIEKVDLTIRARQWEVNGNSGVKAYLKKMYVQIEQDPLDDDYADYN